MYSARRKLLSRAQVAPRSLSECYRAGQTRRIGTLGPQRRPAPALLLSESMRDMRIGSRQSNTWSTAQPSLSPTARPYSATADELITNRFENAQATDEPEETTSARDSENSIRNHESQPAEAPWIAQHRKHPLKHVPNRLKRDKLLLKRAKMFELEKYGQWGYLRHMYPASELAAVKRAFEKWKRAVKRLDRRREFRENDGVDPGKWLYEMSDTTLMRAAWEETSMERRQDIWPQVIMATLHKCPSKAIMVLGATLNPLPMGYAVHDVLRVIAQNLQLSSISNIHDRDAAADEVLSLLTHIIWSAPKGEVPFQQSTIGLFAKILPPSQANAFYDLLKENHFKLHKNTLLHFAGNLGREAAYKNTAFGLLKDMVQTGATLNDTASASVITTLLHCKAMSDGWTEIAEPFAVKDALQFFIENGYSPNTINLTAVLDSLCQHGHTEEAIRLALLFAESGLRLDAKAWSTVYSGAKASLNVDTVAKALMVAKVTPASYEDVLSNALHAVFYFADAETRNKKLQAPWSIPMFLPMLKVYAKKLELKTLQWWLPDSLPLLLSDERLDAETDDKFCDPQGYEWEFPKTILPVVDNLFTADGDAGESKMQLNTAADGVMLRAYIRSLSRPEDILSFYKFFKSRLEEESPYPRLLLEDQGTMIHDTFILVMTQHRQLWREALHVFGDMLRDGLRTTAANRVEDASSPAAGPSDEAIEPDSHNAAVEAAPPEPTGIHPAPNVFTFSILLRGLLFQGEKALADQMIQVMQEHDIKPNLTTWNTLIRHHALAQNTRMTIRLMQEMEATGLRPDTHTYNAFNKLRDQDKALEMMQAILDENHRITAPG